METRNFLLQGGNKSLPMLGAFLVKFDADVRDAINHQIRFAPYVASIGQLAPTTSWPRQRERLGSPRTGHAVPW